MHCYHSHENKCVVLSIDAEMPGLSSLRMHHEQPYMIHYEIEYAVGGH